MQLSTGLLALAGLLANPVFGHMVMKSPVPYGKSTLDNSPLKPDGSDFPCKLRSNTFDPEGADNVLEIGASNTLSFTGGATHNGGSCQVSLTTDLQPSKNSKWMVIKSIEGGCPIQAGPGNCGTTADATCASTFQYTVPEGIAPGKYTIAWSWINHTGNREFYMNCGPATVVGAKKKRYNPNAVVRRQSQFPDMFVANIGINDCNTNVGEGDYAYPNPGDAVERAGNQPLTTLSCNAGGNNAAQQPTAAGGSAPTAAAGASSAVVTSAAAATGFAGSAPSASAGVFAQPSVAASPATSAAAAPAAPVAPAAPAAPAATGSTSGSPSSGASGSCTVGDWNCLDGKSYQRCFGAGTWSPTMQLAAGMTCTPGVSPNLSMAPGKVKRVVRLAEDGLFDGYRN